jgi:hypothetical protein
MLVEMELALSKSDRTGVDQPLIVCDFDMWHGLFPYRVDLLYSLF